MEHYSIIVEPEAQEDLESIFQFISLNDTAVKAENFLQELKTQIITLDSLPFRCRKSYYTDVMLKQFNITLHAYCLIYLAFFTFFL